MHIAFLTPEYPHELVSSSAGIGSSIKNLAKQLVLKEHTVTVFVYGQDTSQIIGDNGITIHKIAYKKYKVLSWYFYRKQIQNYINAVVVSKKIDVIEAPDWTGITAFMKFKCSLLLRLHGTDAYFCNLEGRKQKRKNYVFEKKALKQADYIVSVSKFTAHTTKSIFGLKKNIKIIYNGVDTSLFAPSKEVEVIPKSLLYFGSIIKKKGILELVKIFNLVVDEIPEAKLTLLGKDVTDASTKTSTLVMFKKLLSEKAKRNLIHVENVPYHEVKSYIASANIVVLPSLAEAFPMAWLEALSMGKPLVASNIGWAKELMANNKTGYIEAPENHQLFANKIIELIKDENKSAFFGEQARAHILENFSQEHIGDVNIEFYKSIVQ